MVKFNKTFVKKSALLNYEIFCEELSLDFANWANLPGEYLPGQIFAWRKLGGDLAKASFAHMLKAGLVVAGLVESEIPKCLSVADKAAFDKHFEFNKEYFDANYGQKRLPPKRLSDHQWNRLIQFIGALPDPWIMLPDSLNSAVAKRELGDGMCYLVFKRDKKSYPIISSLCFTETESPTPFNSHSGLIGIWGQIAIRCPVTDDLLKAMAYEVTRRIVILDRLYETE